MIGGFAIPDAIIVLVLVVGALKGFSRGFVRELAGIAAIVIGLIAPWYYNGAADAQIRALTRLPESSAHVAGMIGTGIAAYIVVLIVASILGRIAKLPLLGTGNALAGAIVGLLKGAVLIWIALFVLTLFPLSANVRTSLKQSRLVWYFTMFDAPADAALAKAVPSFARPYVAPLFDQKH
ncbi:MAG TPA: CvpA family protein [Candidatus Tumulicola sp.]|nr:CvpA family protein [Candidatus Tumulicola sp.]